MITFVCEYRTALEVFMLKKKLETEFSTEVKYPYILPAEISLHYGCDLRELFFNRVGKIIDDDGNYNHTLTYNKRENLLHLFQQKQHLFQGAKIPHILTDIDDTLYPNPHEYMGVAGSDSSWTAKQHYPGIRLFYQRFYKNLPKEAQYTTVLSATPGFLKSRKLADKHKLIRPILGESFGFIQGSDTIHEIGTTPLLSVYSHGMNGRFQMYGTTKYHRCREYARLFPEFRLIFIGDNGQGDLIAGKKMLDDVLLADTMVFIHQIVDSHGLKTEIYDGFIQDLSEDQTIAYEEIAGGKKRNKKKSSTFWHMASRNRGNKSSMFIAYTTRDTMLTFKRNINQI